MSVTIETISVTAFCQNCRVLVAADGVTAVIVDPGGQADRILALVDNRKLRVDEIWLTHSHLDHCGGVADIIEATGARLVAHPIEKPLRERVQEIAAMYGLGDTGMRNCPEPQREVRGGEILKLGSTDFEVLFTPGHSMGHVCFYAASERILINGDTIFAGAIGRTDLPGGDHQTLMASIKRIVEKVPPATRLLSGHGPDTVLAEELRTNPFLVSEKVA